MTPTEVNAYYNAPNNYIGMYVCMYVCLAFHSIPLKGQPKRLTSLYKYGNNMGRWYNGH